jgi:hypothetical protein
MNMCLTLLATSMVIESPSQLGALRAPGGTSS